MNTLANISLLVAASQAVTLLTQSQVYNQAVAEAKDFLVEDRQEFFDSEKVEEFLLKMD